MFKCSKIQHGQTWRNQLKLKTYSTKSIPSHGTFLIVVLKVSSDEQLFAKYAQFV